MTFKIPSIINEHIEQFSGRTWLLPILKEWLDNGSEQIFLLTGGPGTGKSMIMGWLATAVSDNLQHQQIQERMTAVHFCRANDRTSYTPLAFAGKMVHQLTQHVVGFDEALMRTLEPHGVKVEINQNIEHVAAGATVTGLEIGKINLAGLSDTDSFDISFVQPLQELYKNGYDQPMLLLVDSMDEAWSGNERGQELVQALGDLAGLPSQIKILVTSRPDPRILKHFRHAQQFDLVHDAPKNVTDIRDFACSWLLHRRNVIDSKADWLAGCIDEAAAGIFLYAYMVLSDVMDHRPSPEYTNAFELPDGMNGIYDEFLTRELGEDEDRWYDELQPLLGLITVAQGEGVTRAKLKALLEHNPTRNLRICHQYLTGALNDGPFRLFHKSLADFLLDNRDNSDYEIDGVEMHGRFAARYQPGIDINELDNYDIRFLADHLARAGRLDDLEGLLLDFNYLQAKLEQTEINDLLNDFDYLQISDLQAPLHLVKGALQLSANILAFDKTQLVGQLMGRLQGFTQPKIQALIAQAKAWRGAPWLRPRQATLTPPGGALIKSFGGDGWIVNVIVASADGELAISGSQYGTLNVWHLISGKLIKSVEYSQPITALGITSDNQQVILGFEDGTLAMSYVESEKTEWLDGHNGRINAIAVMTDGQSFITGSEDKTIKRWRVDNGQLEEAIEHRQPVTALVLTADGQQIIFGDNVGTVTVWPLEDESVDEWQLEDSGRINTIAVTPNGQHIIAGSENGTIDMWDRVDEVTLRMSEETDSIKSLAVTADGQKVISASHLDLTVWNIAVGEFATSIRGHRSNITAVTVTAQVQWIISGSEDGNLKVWDLDRQRLDKTIDKHPSFVRGVAITGNGQQAISGSLDNTFMVWDVTNGKLERTLKVESDPAYVVTVTTDEKWVITGSEDKMVKVWHLASGALEHTLEGHDHTVWALAVTADGQRVISGSEDKTIKVWHLDSGKLERTLEGHRDCVNDVAVTPDRQQIISGSDDGTIKVWHLDSGKLERTLTPPEEFSGSIKAVMVTPDGQRIISGSATGAILIWQMTNGELKEVLNGFGLIHALTVTPDGHQIISGSDDGTIEVWDPETGEPICAFSVEADSYCCAINGERTVIVGDLFGRIHFLDLVAVSD